MTDATELDTAAIRARLEAATPGPWETGDLGGNVVFVSDSGQIITGYEDGDGWVDVREADAEFIAHARTDVERLLAALGEARAEADGRLTAVEVHRSRAQWWKARAEAAESALAAVEEERDEARARSEEMTASYLAANEGWTRAAQVLERVRDALRRWHAEDDVNGATILLVSRLEGALATPTTPEETQP